MEMLDERRYTSELRNASRMWFWRNENTKDYIHEMTRETWKQMQTFNTPSLLGLLNNSFTSASGLFSFFYLS